MSQTKRTHDHHHENKKSRTTFIKKSKTTKKQREGQHDGHGPPTCPGAGKCCIVAKSIKSRMCQAAAPLKVSTYTKPAQALQSAEPFLVATPKNQPDCKSHLREAFTGAARQEARPTNDPHGTKPLHASGHSRLDQFGVPNRVKPNGRCSPLCQK